MSDSQVSIEAMQKENEKNMKNRNAAIKKILSKKMSVKAASKRFRISTKCLEELLKDEEKRKTIVFSKQDSKKLRDHIQKCANAPMGITTTQVRKMVYEYALRLPDCQYPKTWDEHKMATVFWLRYFMSEYPELKKTLNKKNRNNCICIMGCHMGSEGKEAFEELEVKFIITRVYHYLQKEFEYLQTCNDLGLLMNILRRTAEATGVCEQTISSILDEEKRTIESIHNDLPLARQNDVTTVLEDHNYMNGNTSSSSRADTLNESNTMTSNNIHTADFSCHAITDTMNDSNKDTVNKIHSSDFERLQQDCPSIKSVKVEILEDDSDEPGDVYISEDRGDDNQRTTFSLLKPGDVFISEDRGNDSQGTTFSLLKPRHEWLDDDEDDGALVIASEPIKPDDEGDEVMVIETDAVDSQSQNSDHNGTASQNVPTSSQTLGLCIGSSENKRTINEIPDEPLKKRHKLPAQINQVINRIQASQPSHNLVQKPPNK